FLELKALWERSGEGDHVVCLACCEALLELVYDGFADFTYVLNGFLNQVPSASNLSGIVKAIGKLLVFQTALYEESGKTYNAHFH
ncbi:hypothetical protein ScPMuIL_017786, partial [Solemya velum]